MTLRQDQKIGRYIEHRLNAYPTDAMWEQTAGDFFD